VSPMSLNQDGAIAVENGRFYIFIGIDRCISTRARSISGWLTSRLRPVGEHGIRNGVVPRV
jgi:hypothetical protein